MNHTAQTQSPSLKTEFTNSLGLKFVEAGTPGILFSVYNVRVKDWREFAKSPEYSNKFTDEKRGTENNREWEKPFSYHDQSDDEPVVMVSWRDALAFCEWLTRRERALGTIGETEYYDLPTDAHWSKAVGLNEPEDGSPEDKDSKTEGFPWGSSWPPPADAGNYHKARRLNRTSPAGSFAPNRYGLYDMGGNVWEWCKEDYVGRICIEPGEKVLRGGSWYEDHPENFRSSSRAVGASGAITIGFRCVLVCAHFKQQAHVSPPERARSYLFLQFDARVAFNSPHRLWVNQKELMASYRPENGVFKFSSTPVFRFERKERPETLPDAYTVGGEFWMVSDRLKALFETVDPEAFVFCPVEIECVDFPRPATTSECARMWLDRLTLFILSTEEVPAL